MTWRYPRVMTVARFTWMKRLKTRSSMHSSFQQTTISSPTTIGSCVYVVADGPTGTTGPAPTWSGTDSVPISVFVINRPCCDVTSVTAGTDIVVCGTYDEAETRESVPRLAFWPRLPFAQLRTTGSHRPTARVLGNGQSMSWRAILTRKLHARTRRRIKPKNKL